MHTVHCSGCLSCHVCSSAMHAPLSHMPPPATHASCHTHPHPHHPAPCHTHPWPCMSPLPCMPPNIPLPVPHMPPLRHTHPVWTEGMIHDCYCPQCSCSKVMFSQASVILFTGVCVCVEDTPWADTSLSRYPPGQTPPCPVHAGIHTNTHGRARKYYLSAHADG